MEGLSNLNIVIVGVNLPVDRIDLGDLQFLGRPLRERLRLPVVLQASAGEFRLEAMPERFSVAAVDTRATPDKVEALAEAARSLVIDYVGRKSVVAIGHNFTGSIPAESETAEESMWKLANRDSLGELLGAVPGSTSLSVRTRFGRESRVRVKVEPDESDPGKVAYDLNFHFDMQAEAKMSPVEAIEAFGDSLEHGHAVVQRIARL